MQARTAIATVALGLLAACGGGGGGAVALPIAAVAADPKPTQTEQPPEKAPQCSVAYWGDSIAGLTAPRMGKGLQVTLRSVVGGTAQAAQAAFLQDAQVARFVVIEYGTNDANAKAPFDPAMRSMLEWVKAKGRTPVLTGLSNATAGDAAYRATYNAVASQLAKEYGAVWADWAGVPWSASDLMADGVHPADGYQQRLADRLTQAIVAVAPECGGAQ